MQLQQFFYLFFTLILQIFFNLTDHRGVLTLNTPLLNFWVPDQYLITVQSTSNRYVLDAAKPFRAIKPIAPMKSLCAPVPTQ